MHHLEDAETKQLWFTDDVTAGGSPAGLKTWWNCIIDIGPEYGYHPNASNTWLIVKEETLEEATTMFDGTELGRRTICRHNNGNNGARGAPGIIRE